LLLLIFELKMCLDAMEAVKQGSAVVACRVRAQILIRVLFLSPLVE